MTFERVTLPQQPYLYVDRECAYGPEIGAAMGSAFGELMTFLGAKGITPQGMPMSVYLGMDPQILRFRGAILVTEADLAQAAGPVQAANLPRGEGLKAVHVGSYEKMHETHQAMWAHMDAEGIAAGWPIWEIYVDDPMAVPAEAVKTEIYRAIG